MDQPVERSIGPAEIRRRLGAVGVGAVCLSLLFVAGSLDADRDGLGTHTQMGLPACGFKVFNGVPCPSCGMTTAFAHAANGQLLAAFVTQPFGAALAVITAMAAVISVWVAATGMPIGRWLRPLRSYTTLWVGLGLIVAAWLYKMAIHQGA